MEGTKTLNQALSTLTQHELLFLGQTRRATQRDAPKIRSCGVGLGESRGDSAGALLADALAAPASSQASKSKPTRLRLRLTQRASTWPGSCSYSSCFLGFFQPCCIGSGRACMDSRGPATRMERFMVLGRISKNWERFEKKHCVRYTRPRSRRSSDRGQLQPGDRLVPAAVPMPHIGFGLVVQLENGSLEHQEGKQVFVVQGTVPGSPSDRGQLQPGDRLVGVLGSSPASVRCRVPHDCAR